MSSVLITGADGFLGRYISKELVQRRFDVYSRRRIDGDVRESATWEQFPEANYLIHLAGTTFVPASWDSPTEFVHSNLISTSHALDYCRKHKTIMILFSTYLYSKTARQLTIKEEQFAQLIRMCFRSLWVNSSALFMQIILIFSISELVFLIQLAT